MAGLFFCLAPAEGAGLLFCPAAYQPHASVYSGFSVVRAIILSQSQNRLQGFTAAFPLILPISARTIQQSHKPPIRQLRHAGKHTVKRYTSANTRYHRHAGRCTDQHRQPIIIMYIRAHRCPPVMDSCQTVQHITDHASPVGSAPTVCGSMASAAPGAPAEGCSVSTCTGSARRLAVWHRVSSQGAPCTRRGGPAAEARRAGGTTGGLPPLLFSGFRPIANRGQK
jgi:hypothetical protein